MAAVRGTRTKKNTADDVYEFPYIKPEDLGWLENWKRELWNPDTRQVLGRTGKSWGEFMYYKLSPYIVKHFTSLLVSSTVVFLNLCETVAR